MKPLNIQNIITFEMRERESTLNGFIIRNLFPHLMGFYFRFRSEDIHFFYISYNIKKSFLIDIFKSQYLIKSVYYDPTPLLTGCYCRRWLLAQFWLYIPKVPKIEGSPLIGVIVIPSGKKVLKKTVRKGFQFRSFLLSLYILAKSAFDVSI